jgi:hypothetical protein
MAGSPSARRFPDHARAGAGAFVPRRSSARTIASAVAQTSSSRSHRPQRRCRLRRRSATAMPTNAIVGVAAIAPSCCAERRSPIGAGARARRFARPSGRACRVTGTRWRSAKLSRRGLDHVGDAAARLDDEVVDIAPPSYQAPRRNVPRSPASSLSTQRTTFWESGTDALAARNHERFFASGKPPVAPYGPMTDPDRLIHSQPEI